MVDNTMVLVHFYRAAVVHADVWRRRLDATTNWAVVTTAAVVTFAFGEAQAPHFVLLMALLFGLFFLVMESRRYQIYHVWELLIRDLHQYLIVPALLKNSDTDEEAIEAGLARIARDLGSTLPRISILEAAGLRIRRNYGPLFTILLMAWLLKLWLSPRPSYEAAEFVARAAVGVVPGAAVLVAMGVFFAGCVIAALSAPSEHIVDWAADASPARKLVRRKGLPIE